MRNLTKLGLGALSSAAVLLGACEAPTGPGPDPARLEISPDPVDADLVAAAPFGFSGTATFTLTNTGDLPTDGPLQLFVTPDPPVFTPPATPFFVSILPATSPCIGAPIPAHTSCQVSLAATTITGGTPGQQAGASVAAVSGSSADTVRVTYTLLAPPTP